MVPIEKYFKNQIGYLRRELGMMTSRGCPFKCSFCSNPVWNHIVRMRSPINVVDEMEYLYKKYRVQGIFFFDDTFNLQPKWVDELCDEIIKRGLHKKLVWRAVCRVNKNLVSLDLFSKMKEAGCWMLSFGVESGNQYVLDINKKGITLDEARNAVQTAKKIGLKTGAFFMIGNIGENTDTINDTINFAIELQPHFCQFNIATPYPGSELFNIVMKDKDIKEIDWSVYNQRTPIFDVGNLKTRQLRRHLTKAYRRYYLRPKYIINQLYENIAAPIKLLAGVKKIYRNLF